ncbi:hypothetical protein D3C87_1360100 [compost metagenome]
MESISTAVVRTSPFSSSSNLREAAMAAGSNNRSAAWAGAARAAAGGGVSTIRPPTASTLVGMLGAPPAMADISCPVCGSAAGVWPML